MNRLFEELAPVMALDQVNTKAAQETDTFKIGRGKHRRILFYTYIKVADNHLRIDEDGPNEVELTLKERKGLTGDKSDLKKVDWKAGMGAQKAKVMNADDWTDGDTITINGVEFEKVESTDSGNAADKEFADGAELEAAVNMHIDGMTADDTANDVEIEVDDPAESFDIEADITNDTNETWVYILECAAIMEAHVSELDQEDGFNAVLLEVDASDAQGSDSINTTGFVVLGNNYKEPVLTSGKVF